MSETRTLRERRLSAELTIQQLADMARCSIASVRLFESGYRPARGSAALARVRAILDAFDVSPENGNARATNAGGAGGGATDDGRRNI